MVTEPYGPEGVYGQWLSYLMVMIPAGWLAALWVKDRKARTGEAKEKEGVRPLEDRAGAAVNAPQVSRAT
jgi:hypothetical protein